MGSTTLGGGPSRQIDPRPDEPSLTRQLSRGFPQGPEVPDILKEFQQSNLSRTLLAASLDIVAPMAIAAMGLWLLEAAPLLLALPLNALVLILIARFQRGQENLTHEGSHQNWFRGSQSRLIQAIRSKPVLRGVVGRGLARKINDTLTNLFAALPIFNTVGSYWVGHRLHHNHFSSEVDPCKGRFVYFDRSNTPRFLFFILKGIGPYISGWWLTFGLKAKNVVWGLLWHTAVWIVPASLLLGWPTGVLVWLVYWLAPFVLVLPWLRFISESGKHNYEEGTEFDATISNIGWIHGWYFNPHGDGYHVLHHWAPAIPHHQLKKAHHALIGVEPVHYGMKHRHRVKVLQNPQTGDG